MLEQSIMDNFHKRQPLSAILCQQEFLSSGTFVMPADVFDNQILVATTGGGGAGLMVTHKPAKRGESVDGRGGGGSGVRFSLLTMNEGSTASVLVGGSVPSAYIYRNRYAFSLSSSPGGTSSFTGAESCPGGEGVTMIKEQDYTPVTITAGGNGKAPRNDCTEFPHLFFAEGGAGYYGKASFCADSPPGSGAGAGEMNCTANWKSGSGRVVIFYYKSVKEDITHGDPSTDIQYALLDDNNIVENIIVVPNSWNGPGINISKIRANVQYINISDEDRKEVNEWQRDVGIADVYNPDTNKFISASLTVDYRWRKEQNNRLKYLLNQ